MAARRAVLGAAADGPPRLLLRAGSFPHPLADEDPRPLRHARRSGARTPPGRGRACPYLLAVTPRVSRRPAGPARDALAAAGRRRAGAADRPAPRAASRSPPTASTTAPAVARRARRSELAGLSAKRAGRAPRPAPPRSWPRRRSAPTSSSRRSTASTGASGTCIAQRFARRDRRPRQRRRARLPRRTAVARRRGVAARLRAAGRARARGARRRRARWPRRAPRSGQAPRSTGARRRGADALAALAAQARPWFDGLGALPGRCARIGRRRCANVRARSAASVVPIRCAASGSGACLPTDVRGECR